MACTMFWRCESTTFDATHDFSAGDSTPTAVSLIAIDNTADRYGTNGINANVTSNDYYEFDAASIFSTTEGAVGFKLQIKATGGDTEILAAYNAGAPSDQIILQTNGTDELLMRHRVNGGDNNTVTTTAADMAVDTWYGVVIRWDTNAEVFRIEVYNDNGTLKHGVSNAIAISPQGALTIFSLGTNNGSARFWIDNFVVGNDYDDPIQTWIDYTSYTQISGGSSSIGRMLLLGVK